MSKEFTRTDVSRYLKLGRRKKRRTWRKAKGRDNKIRLKRFGYPTSPTIGHKSPKQESGKIKGLTPVLVRNVKDLEKLDKDSIPILAKIGAKKKLDVIKKAEEMKIKILNVKKEAKK